MDFMEMQRRVRDFDMFLSGGASIVPEPVYERDVRRHVDHYSNRTPAVAPDILTDFSDGVEFEEIEIDLAAKQIVVRQLQVDRSGWTSVG